MSDYTITADNVNTTWDPPSERTVLLQVDREGDHFLVRDIGLGSMYGAGDTLAEALADYATALTELCEVLSEHPLSPRLAAELAAYRAFLRETS